MTWTCVPCGAHLDDYLALDNHLRLLHPDVDREVTGVADATVPRYRGPTVRQADRPTGLPLP